ncbi:hypothetical protein SCHPADRAFT_312231 [Schizopora paradoxa]|uniref:Uncharacterized protein n=1 Tax=Schizopora paradoxa TaxID=27342 RepID=A0A0H2SC37_9AGAM|nr:hypothetical protein SCHPADRAFT_312231 [Schizopora paradoxa]
MFSGYGTFVCSCPNIPPGVAYVTAHALIVVATVEPLWTSRRRPLALRLHDEK